MTGLLGMGHDTVLHLLFGSVPASAGTAVVSGRGLDLAAITPRKAMDAGMALLPSNRLRDGAVAAATAAENMTLATLGNFHISGFLRHRREEKAVRELMGRFDVRPMAPDLPLGTFSGGNQQKALVAKWFSRQPRVMLLDEPTHGVDVGAKKQIFQHLRNAAEEGMAALVSSVEAEDLAQMCDRVLVFRYGRVVAELSGTELTATRITEQALMGGRSGHAETIGEAVGVPSTGVTGGYEG